MRNLQTKTRSALLVGFFRFYCWLAGFMFRIGLPPCCVNFPSKLLPASFIRAGAAAWTDTQKTGGDA